MHFLWRNERKSTKRYAGLLVCVVGHRHCCVVSQSSIFMCCMQVHGVNSIVEETPEFVAERVAAMRSELAKFSVTKRRAFDRAIFLKPRLEKDTKLYLLFLRSERFDPISAAQKLCLHFDHKLELFGEVNLPKEITLDDLDEDDLEIFQTGCQLVLPHKDRSGRTIQIISIPRMKFKHWKNMVSDNYRTVSRSG